jgi:hypothetical protein
MVTVLIILKRIISIFYKKSKVHTTFLSLELSYSVSGGEMLLGQFPEF